MKIQKYEMREVNLDVRGITLLSMEEYKEMKDHIPHLTDRWWLRSPGHIDRTHPTWRELVCFVNEYGIAHDNCSVDDAGVAVRPALEISDNTLRAGDRFRLFGHEWTVISDQYALCDEPIGHMVFWKADYANDYDKSHVKRFVETWLAEQRVPD